MFFKKDHALQVSNLLDTKMYYMIVSKTDRSNCWVCFQFFEKLNAINNCNVLSIFHRALNKGNCGKFWQSQSQWHRKEPLFCKWFSFYLHFRLFVIQSTIFGINFQNTNISTIAIKMEVGSKMKLAYQIKFPLHVIIAFNFR